MTRCPNPSPAILAATLAWSLATPLTAADPLLLEPHLRQEGWIQLFDGESLFGWTATSNVDWQIRDGEIRATRGEPGFLMSHSEFGNVELHVEFQAGARTNSGVFVHTVANPKDPSKDCYEINLVNVEHPYPTGSLVARAPAVPRLPASSAWQSLTATLRDGHVSVAIDGRAVVDYVDEQPLGRGRIALQYNEGEIHFRNVRVRPLFAAESSSLMNRAKWHPPTGSARLDVGANGAFELRGGPGQLETRSTYRDFVLQLECKTHAQGLNSGIFFRAIPGETMNGYESQIHNAYQGDPTRPTHGGTGAIFNRVVARRVVARDGDWFHKTIVASGPHIAVWVEGYPVSAWTDERAPHPNPRQGLRLDAGTLILQAHDPTTHVSFRHMQIAELSERPEGFPNDEHGNVR